MDGQLVQGFLYGDDLGPEAELNADGSVKARFVYGSSTVTPDYMVRGCVTYRIVSDERGSPRLIVNSATGEVAQELEYDSYGRITRDTNPGFQPFGFAGGLYDSDTGLTHFGARDYDAETGRFVSQDPLDFSGGDANLYAYAWGDPVNVVDPEGLGGLGIGSWLKDRASHYGREALNYDVAFSDEITGGGVMATLMLTGGIDQIDICSGAFRQCGHLGFAAAFFIPGGGEAKVVRGASRFGVMRRFATTPWGRTIERFRANPNAWRRTSAHAEEATS